MFLASRPSLSDSRRINFLSMRWLASVAAIVMGLLWAPSVHAEPKPYNHSKNIEKLCGKDADNMITSIAWDILDEIRIFLRNQDPKVCTWVVHFEDTRYLPLDTESRIYQRNESAHNSENVKRSIREACRMAWTPGDRCVQSTEDLLRNRFNNYNTRDIFLVIHVNYVSLVPRNNIHHIPKPVTYEPPKGVIKLCGDRDNLDDRYVFLVWNFDELIETYLHDRTTCNDRVLRGNVRYRLLKYGEEEGNRKEDVIQEACTMAWIRGNACIKRVINSIDELIGRNSPLYPVFYYYKRISGSIRDDVFLAIYNGEVRPIFREDISKLPEDIEDNSTDWSGPWLFYKGRLYFILREIPDSFEGRIVFVRVL